MHRDRTGSPADLADIAARPGESPSAGAPSDQGAPCDACGEAVPAASEHEGYEVPGRGVYLWVRGDKVTLEHVPLCARCASAIGMKALSRWEIEEEEG
jgi:hypothetical protein